MKSAYELAMERLSKTAPAVKLTAAQKQELAELESVYAAKIAGREIAMKDALAAAHAAGDFEREEKTRQQWLTERQQLQAELETKKDRVRNPAGE
jgi:hypothetical protein